MVSEIDLGYPSHFQALPKQAEVSNEKKLE
jgi:hypothetical protein